MTSSQNKSKYSFCSHAVTSPCPLAAFGLEARQLGLFDVGVIVDEGGAEIFSENRVRAQRGERFAEIFRQRRRLGLVGRIGRRPGIAALRDAVEAGIDLRRHVEIGIGRGLADAVFQMRRRIARLAEHAHHDAAIVARPDRAIGRQRIGAGSAYSR